MALKPCLECGRPCAGPRCTEHRIPGTTVAGNVTYAEKQRRRRVVAEWVAAYGWVCPGYGVPAHPSTDLTADHLLAQVHGGAAGPLRVLCRSCNSRRGSR